VADIDYSMCLFPVRAEKQEFGRPKLDPEGSLLLPCGKCYECKSKRAFDWATRCRHEIACHSENCFITLTYDDENLPSPFVVKNYFQKFMKRLRKKAKSKLKYIVSHEYGSRTGRPHHHAIIFGWTPSNQEYLQEAPSGEPLFTSQDLSELWTHGFHSIGEANEKTAYYIASYSLKANTHRVTDPDTGEIRDVSDSMDCSKRTAIGYEYFMKHVNQLAQSNLQLPRYYTKLLERKFPHLLEIYENDSMLRNDNQRGAHERLAKYVITQQKETSDSNYRTAPDDRKKLYGEVAQLKQSRDDFVKCSTRRY
jgi:hypothetical protein